MGFFIRLLSWLTPMQLVAPVFKPLTRLILGLIAIPLFRGMLRKLAHGDQFNEELEKDLEQWFRGSLLLLIATRNMESLLFSWVNPDLRDEKAWFFLAGRILLAVGVIEGMPDQALFTLIHPGPPKPQFEAGKIWAGIRAYIRPLLRGLLCQHLARSSPVLAILAAIEQGTIGWVAYWMAITQYLIIGLVTSRDRALDVLSRFDQAVQHRRAELEQELTLAEEARENAAERLPDTYDSAGM